MRKYRGGKIKRNELPSLSGMTERGKGGHRRRSAVYYPIGTSSRSEINEMLILLNKYQRDMSFMKYLFVANCVIMAILISGSVHLLWGDSMNKYILTKIEKLLTEVKNSSKTQTIMKGILSDLLCSVVNDEKNKNATKKFFLDTLQNSKTEMGSVFTDVLQTEHVRNSLKNVFQEVSSYLSRNEQMHMKVYHLLSQAIHLPIAINTSKRWLNNLLKSESVTSNVREVLRNEVFKNDQVVNDSVLFVQNALLTALQDKETKEASKFFFASILSNPEFQQQISGNIWKIVKLALSPKWMTYEGDDLQVKVGHQPQCPSRNTGEEEAPLHNPLLDAGKSHLGTISCDVHDGGGVFSDSGVSHVDDVRHISNVHHVTSIRLNSDDLVEAHPREAVPNREELLPLGRNKGNAPSGAAPVEGCQMGEVALEKKQVMSETKQDTNEREQTTNEAEQAANEMRHVINLFERAHMCDGHADVTACKQTYTGQAFQTNMAGNLRHVDTQQLDELRSFLFPPHPSQNNSTPISGISISKFKSVKEGAGHLESLRTVHRLNGSYFANRIERSDGHGGGAIPPGTVLPGEAPLGTTSRSGSVPGSAMSSSAIRSSPMPNYSPTDHAITPTRGIAVRVKFFLLDAYRFYAQKYYFYYYYVERVKAVLQKALGVKFF
ncbi:hypothetical protein C922_02575 [Plasmodium inui San Antonio 1]|uniref:Uncharacterized protein n=1 Tax=Plasmodium inui San Antonio 1 TaxID=1237626 RepID=W7ANR7_9APIC|nr:hypothetical protein C922_02575 [Plasmodium inui San Antonio 1]EUD66991.1 hypothetical protein C922_02575 [Plasmodium inui San Antonio 1]